MLKYVKLDGLILVSLYGADKGAGATLPATIGYAEMLTHSVPSAENLSQALTRFLQAGFLKATSAGYVLSDDIRAQLKTAIGQEGKWADLPDKGFAVLKQRHDVPVNTDDVDLTPEQVEDAMQEFQKGNQ